MNRLEASCDHHWYVIYTHPKQNSIIPDSKGASRAVSLNSTGAAFERMRRLLARLQQPSRTSAHTHSPSKKTLDCVPRWYVIQTKARQEDRAEANLRAWGVETFAPKIRQQQHFKNTGRTRSVIRLLFASYIFARFKVSELGRKVGYTRGVHGIVCAGAGPTPVDDKIIELIESQKDADGFVRIDKLLRPCDEVTIPKGPLRDLIGVFEGRYEAGERVSVLLTTVTNDATQIKTIQNF